ncbi:hypothetical protein AVEN_201512-1, partial [Araneus ventricosus]
HHWYQGSRPGGCLSIDRNRRDQTTLTPFLSVMRSAQNVLQNRY